VGFDKGAVFDGGGSLMWTWFDEGAGFYGGAIIGGFVLYPMGLCYYGYESMNE